MFQHKQADQHSIFWHFDQMNNYKVDENLNEKLDPF